MYSESSLFHKEKDYFHSGVSLHFWPVVIRYGFSSLLLAAAHIGVVSQLQEAVSVYHNGNTVSRSLVDHNPDAAKLRLIASKAFKNDFLNDIKLVRMIEYAT